MASTPPAKPLFRAFGELLDGHLRGGTRPDPNDRKAWTNEEFAGRISGRARDGMSAPNSVANWRNGKNLPEPETFEFILPKLFGPARPGAENSARDALRAAYTEALRLKSLRALKQAREPAGQTVVIAGPRMAFRRTPAPADLTAARDPDVQAAHARQVERMRGLVDIVRRRHNQLSDGWDDLLAAAERFLRAIDCPVEDLPHHLLDAYQESVSLAFLLEQDNRFRRHPEPGEQPLPAELGRKLGEAVTFAAQLLHEFPYVQRKDVHLRRFLRPDDLAASAAVADSARRVDLLPDIDLDLLRTVLDAAGRHGWQADKARDQAIGTIVNILLAGAGAALSPEVMAELKQRLDRFFRDAAPGIEFPVRRLRARCARGAALRHGAGRGEAAGRGSGA